MKKTTFGYAVMQEHNDIIFGVYTDPYLAFKKYLEELKAFSWNRSFYVRVIPMDTDFEINTMTQTSYSIANQQYIEIKNLSEEELLESNVYLAYLKSLIAIQKNTYGQYCNNDEENS